MCKEFIIEESSAVNQLLSIVESDSKTKVIQRGEVFIFYNKNLSNLLSRTKEINSLYRKHYLQLYENIYCWGDKFMEIAA